MQIRVDSKLPEIPRVLQGLKHLAVKPGRQVDLALDSILKADKNNEVSEGPGFNNSWKHRSLQRRNWTQRTSVSCQIPILHQLIAVKFVPFQHVRKSPSREVPLHDAHLDIHTVISCSPYFA